MSGGPRALRKLKKPYRRFNKFVPRQIIAPFSVVVILIILILVIAPGSLRADTQGANNPGTMVNDAGTGSTAWTSPGNVASSNNVWASVALSNGGASNYIKATNFGFSIPAGSTINGIVAEMERSEANANGNNFCQDNAVRIVKGGTIGSTDRSNTGVDWPTTEAYFSYGSSSDPWGETWTVSDINASNFGFAISAANRRGSGNPSTTETCRVDHIRITVHYTQPPTTYDQSAYRWFSNNNGTNVGSALANQDTSATAPVKDTPFRLRMMLHVGTTNLAQNGQNFKLQFAKKGSGSCASPEFSYADVTTSSSIRYYDNAAAADGAAVTTNANDPQHSTHTKRGQTYEEANNFTNSQSSISTGEDGMWDFSLVDNSADYGSNYCFKTVLSSGSNIDSYGVYPEITTASAPTIDQSAYRLFEHQAATREFGTSGVVTGASASFFGRAIAMDDSYIYVAGDDDAQDWRIEKRALSNGALDNGFGSSGVVTGAAGSNISRSISIDGSYMYVVGDDSGGDWRIEKRALSNGAVDNGFGSSGVVTGASASVLAYFVTIDGSYMYVTGNDSNSDWRIEKRALSNGAVDNGFGTSGVVTGASASDTAIAVIVDDGYMYVAGEDANDDWRIEKRALSNGGLASAASADVGSPLASQDTSASLTSTGQGFRLRLDLHINTNKLKTSGQNFKLQSAKKGTGSCASPEFSYTDVSAGSGEIRYNNTGNDGIPLTDNANDPAHSGHTNNNQTYEEANNFTNSESAVAAGEDGLWDFALVDNSAPGDTAYCFKVVDSSGSNLNSYGVYPEISTYNPGGTGTTADIVDAAGIAVADPVFSLTNHTLSFSCGLVSGSFASSSQRIRIANGFTAENWSLTLAATDGATAVWSGGPTDYDFNDSNGSPNGCSDGGDSDSLAGQMSFDPSAGTLSPEAGCSNTGITKGSSSSFAEGTNDSLSILSGTTSSDTDCYWDLTGVDVSQQIPPDQPTGSYSINLTLTLTVF